MIRSQRAASVDREAAVAITNERLEIEIGLTDYSDNPIIVVS